jgi:hypothetical protein
VSAAISADDYARLRTWILEIAEALLPGTQRQDRGGDWRFSHAGGLSIAKRSGVWFSHAEGKGGYSAVGLIALLRPCDWAEAEQWAAAWLANHPGTGSCDAGDDDDDASQAAREANSARAKEIIQAMAAAEDTVAETYLRSRDLPPPYPACARFLADARIGESALVGLLTAHNVVIGAQLTYLAPDGRKSLREPVRQTFVLDRERARGAVFEVERLSSNARMLLVEGLEDGLSLRACGRPESIYALPGIAGLKHFPARRGHAITVVRDGDAADSAADKALVAGVDHLLLERADVRVTATPGGEDANGILQAKGADALNALVDGAVPATLSFAGEVKRLARLQASTDPSDAAEYARLRVAAKKRQPGMTLEHLDRLVRAALAPSAAKDDAEETEDTGIKLPEYPPWDGPPVVLADVLDETLATLRRFIVAPTEVLVTNTLWSAMTHLVHHPNIDLGTVPRLHLCGPPTAGKTTSLDCVMTLSARSLLAASTSASAVLRSMGVLKPTLGIDEIDNVLSDKNSDLLAILNASNRRRTAFVLRSVPTPDGKGWEAKLFSVWGAIASAGLEPLPPTQQSRAITWIMQVATTEAIPEQLEDGTAPKLIELHRKLASWAASLDNLPKRSLPAALAKQPGRIADLWRPLVNIAALAGGDWPARVADAIDANLKTERLPSVKERVLLSLRRAFDLQRHLDQKKSAAQLDKAADNPTRMTTPTLVERLCADPEEEWRTANDGRPITPYYFRRALLGLLAPPGTQDWWTGPRDKRTHHSGYLRTQLERTWETILRLPADFSLVPVESPSPHPSRPSGAPGASGATRRKPGFFGDGSGAGAPDASGAPQEGDAQVNPGAPDGSGAYTPDGVTKKPTKSRGEPCAPDAPDAEGGWGRRENSDGKGTGRTAKDAQPTRVWPRAVGPVEQAICDLAAANPTWSEDRLAKAAGQPIGRVRKALNGGRKPDGAGDTASPTASFTAAGPAAAGASQSDPSFSTPDPDAPIPSWVDAEGVPPRDGDVPL